ncbi:hypothetical protein [Fodinicola feengrottensis]|uniref:hypothetical protein n=1 Tax=Fodinicola feengrottensis TaxID=435914 RepID=UPI0013D8BA77|nr:hypothetical protein [Fodinicola feengrottensis]
MSPSPQQSFPDAPPEVTNPVTGWITDAISQWLAGVIASAMTPVLTFMGQTVLITPDPTTHGGVLLQLWEATRIAANTCFILLILVGGFLVMGRESIQTRVGIREIAPRIAIGFIAANTSTMLISKAIELANGLTAAIAGQGVDTAAVSASLQQMITNQLNGLGFLGSLLELALLVMAVMVIVTFIVRMAAMVLLVLAAPIALSCHALPQTERIAFTWWRTWSRA